MVERGRGEEREKERGKGEERESEIMCERGIDQFERERERDGVFVHVIFIYFFVRE
jgi:hypothetical protein